MYESGAFVADHVDPVAAEQVQPNGVDLTVEAVLEQVEAGRIGTDGKTIGARDPVEPDAGEDGDVFVLQPGGYVLQYAETISIPEAHVGFVYPRSSLMRNSCMLNSAVWDAGYTGKGEGLLEVHHEVELERGARVAQLVLADADHAATYDGSYQGERTPGE
ncbi:deoxyuridine 5'-triphosphate nucleotidohydrolase [Halobacterium rubrum]|uniref:deoxyuridine 5'-triphosphate nucleotidohydrolase n=1 Tax=Halobacterium TaxID=2239 RepID=UPI001F261679|nr:MULTISPECIES: deoxyuridine 5'-triphosphate nucleotidohydrolase [Halobacterium]MDH5020475.1 deoxyuridine 5'-triphosphate nucleotidohydrolase [Halobacterium rubrum]